MNEEMALGGLHIRFHTQTYKSGSNFIICTMMKCSYVSISKMKTKYKIHLENLVPQSFFRLSPRSFLTLSRNPSSGCPRDPSSRCLAILLDIAPQSFFTLSRNPSSRCPEILLDIAPHSFLTLCRIMVENPRRGCKMISFWVSG